MNESHQTLLRECRLKPTVRPGRGISPEEIQEWAAGELGKSRVGGDGKLLPRGSLSLSWRLRAAYPFLCLPPRAQVPFLWLEALPDPLLQRPSLDSLLSLPFLGGHLVSPLSRPTRPSAPALSVALGFSLCLCPTLSLMLRGGSDALLPEGPRGCSSVHLLLP